VHGGIADRLGDRWKTGYMNVHGMQIQMHVHFSGNSWHTQLRHS
jgi:hypothetical protein